MAFDYKIAFTINSYKAPYKKEKLIKHILVV